MGFRVAGQQPEHETALRVASGGRLIRDVP